MKKPSKSQVEKIMQYDPKTGKLTYLMQRGPRAAGDEVGVVNDQGYRIIYLFGRRYRASWVANLLMTGKWPRCEMDHINRCPSDDRWCNLREATRLQNCQNMSRTNRFGLRGVSQRQGTKTFAAKIRLAGKHIYLGSFSSAKDAHAAYLIAARRLHGEFAYDSGRHDPRL